jgi:hypothetical protein
MPLVTTVKHITAYKCFPIIDIIAVYFLSLQAHRR